jgi:hypothetical protein
MLRAGFSIRKRRSGETGGVEGRRGWSGGGDGVAEGMEWRRGWSGGGDGVVEWWSGGVVEWWSTRGCRASLVRDFSPRRVQSAPSIKLNFLGRRTSGREFLPGRRPCTGDRHPPLFAGRGSVNCVNAYIVIVLVLVIVIDF